jgi:hypothetical protein
MLRSQILKTADKSMMLRVLRFNEGAGGEESGDAEPDEVHSIFGQTITRPYRSKFF